MPTKDIDAIWASMKAKNAPSNKTADEVDRMLKVDRKLNSGIGINDSDTVERVGDGRSSQPRPAVPETSKAGQTMNLAAVEASLPRHIASLTDPSQQTRRRALEQIKVTSQVPCMATDMART